MDAWHKLLSLVKQVQKFNWILMIGALVSIIIFYFNTRGTQNALSFMAIGPITFILFLLDLLAQKAGNSVIRRLENQLNGVKTRWIGTLAQVQIVIYSLNFLVFYSIYYAQRYFIGYPIMGYFLAYALALQILLMRSDYVLSEDKKRQQRGQQMLSYKHHKKQRRSKRN